MSPPAQPQAFHCTIVFFMGRGGEQNGHGGTYPEGDGARGLLRRVLVQSVSQRRQDAFPVANQTDF